MSDSWYTKGTGESVTIVEPSAPLIHHDPGRSWITVPDPDHPKGTHLSSFLAACGDCDGDVSLGIHEWLKWFGAVANLKTCLSVCILGDPGTVD